MAETKLEALVARLEIAVAKQEALAGGSGGVAQAAAGGAQTSGCALAKSYAAKVGAAIDDVKAKTAAADNTYVTEITGVLLKLVYMQGQTLTTMAKFKKPADMQFLFAPLKVSMEAAEKMKRDRKSPINQVSVANDAMQMFQYPAFTDTKVLVDTTEEFFDMIPFNGNKILKAGVDKDVEWYKSVLALCTAIKEFTLENCTKVNTWYGAEDASGAPAYFASATTDDKCGDFASLDGVATSAGPAAATSAGPATAAPGGSSAGDELANELLSATSAHLAAMKAAAATIGNETCITVTANYEKAMQNQASLLRAMATFRKPADVTFCTTASPIVTFMKDSDAAGMKDRKSPIDIMKVCTDGFQLFFWNTTMGNDLLVKYMDEIEAQILFYGNKIRTKGKDNEKPWFEAYFAMMTALKAFIVPKQEFICDWRGKQDGSGAAAFMANSSGGAPAATAASAAPEEKKVAAAPAKAAPKAAAGKKAPAAPIKKMQGSRWIVENWENETIVFDDEDEVHKRISFAFFNCNKCTIKIVGKCMSVGVQNCKGTTFETDKIISQLELLKCQNSIVRAKNQMPMIAVEGCQQTHIWLTEATKNVSVSTSCTRSTVLHYPKPGMTEADLEDMGNWTQACVPEVFTTTIKDEAVFTEGYMEDD